MAEWEGQTVLDRDGEKIGKIEEVFLVEETGRPEWGLVKMGRIKGRATLVPLTRAHFVKDGVKVHVDKDVISNAPEIDPDSDPSQEQVDALYRHYGLDTGNGSRQTNGAAAGAPQQPAPAANTAQQQQQQQRAPSPVMYGSPTPSQSFGSPTPPPASPPPPPQPSGGSGGYGDLRDAPIGEVLNTVKEEGSNLVSQELRLAKAEMSGKAKDVGIGAGMFGGAGYMASIAGIALMLTVLYALGEFMDLWLAALITTVLFAAIAAVLALKGKKKIQEAGPPIPEQTVESVKQTIQTVKEEAKWGLGQTR